MGDSMANIYTYLYSITSHWCVLMVCMLRAIGIKYFRKPFGSTNGIRYTQELDYRTFGSGVSLKVVLGNTTCSAVDLGGHRRPESIPECDLEP